jgi:two-component sensor histidine kinase
MVEGPAVQLDSKAALTLAMALHELATNAAKYGALSSPDGRVEVTWRNRRLETGRRLTLRWVEAGGPVVTPPSTKSFGTWLITEGLTHELDIAVQLDFDPAGVRCTIDLPLPAEGAA